MIRDENWYFHNTKELLKKYRQVMMSIDENLDEMETNINDIGDRFAILAEFIRVEDIDLSGIKLENHIRCMERTRQMVNIIDSAIAKLRKFDILEILALSLFLMLCITEIINSPISFNFVFTLGYFLIYSIFLQLINIFF